VIEEKDVEEVKEKGGKVAAFFDLDGTLLPLPSMEKRFFAMLRYRRRIGIRNYLLWLREAARLAPRGLNQILHANKMYLRGVRVNEAGGGTDIPVGRLPEEGTEQRRQVARERTKETSRQAGMPVPLYPEAIERVAWHVERGHLIFIVSGTLEPLTKRVVRALEHELCSRGQACGIRVCATRLEEKKERWTGRIVGEAMFGEAKAHAIRQIAADADLDLRRCFAYGDSSADRWMLAIVGKPAAVNPSNDLARIARRNDWAVLRWGEEKHFTQRIRRTQRSQRAEEAGATLRSVREEAGLKI
jgi:HAD superfamily hydrolase (TIGR01490 family)